MPQITVLIWRRPGPFFDCHPIRREIGNLSIALKRMAFPYTPTSEVYPIFTPRRKPVI